MWRQEAAVACRALRLTISAFPSSEARPRRVDCFPNFSFSARALAAETLKLGRTLSDLLGQGKIGEVSANIWLE